MATILDGGAWGWVGYLTVTQNIPITIPRSSRVTTVRGCLWEQDAGTSGTEVQCGGWTEVEKSSNAFTEEEEFVADVGRKALTKNHSERFVLR